MSEHRHLVKGEVNNALQVAWCRCGAVYRLTTEKWEPPKYTEGLARAQSWRPEEDE